MLWLCYLTLWYFWLTSDCPTIWSTQDLERPISCSLSQLLPPYLVHRIRFSITLDEGVSCVWDYMDLKLIPLGLYEFVAPVQSVQLSCVMGNRALRFLPFTVPTKWSGAHRFLCPKIGLRIHSYFGYDTNYKIVHCCLHGLYSVVSVIPKKDWQGPSLPILIWVWQHQRPLGLFSRDACHITTYT